MKPKRNRKHLNQVAIITIPLSKEAIEIFCGALRIHKTHFENHSFNQQLAIISCPEGQNVQNLPKAIKAQIG